MNSVDNYIDRVFCFLTVNVILASTSNSHNFYGSGNKIYRRQYTLARLERTYPNASRNVYW
ncbi:conserved hypothetical protein [Tenacibaculum sp. 190130A14a]